MEVVEEETTEETTDAPTETETNVLPIPIATDNKPKSVFTMKGIANPAPVVPVTHAQELFDEKDVKDFVHLQKCWERYCDFGGATPDLINEMKANDVEMWMSGLACCRNPVCKAAYECIIPPAPNAPGTTSTNTANKKKNSYMNGKFYDKNCPPGCGCDNPWPFMLNM